MSNIEHNISEMELAGCIDHTLLDATATQEQIELQCRDAKTWGFHTVCVNGRWIPLVAELLADGATVEDIKLMKNTAPGCKIKAAGGIRTAKQALEMLAAGAQRIGTSSGVRIMTEFKAGQ